MSRVSKETIEQHHDKGLLKVVSVTLNKDPVSKLFNYDSAPSEGTGNTNDHKLTNSINHMLLRVMLTDMQVVEFHHFSFLIWQYKLYH